MNIGYTINPQLYVGINQTGQFYPVSNPSGFITGINTGNFASISQVNSLSGFVVNASGALQNQIAGFATTTTLTSTGSILYQDITGLSGVLNIISGVLQVEINNLNTATGYNRNSITSLSGFTTGVSGYLSSLISLASAGVSNINGISGAINLIGTGNVTILTTGQTIIVSGDTGAYVNFATVSNLVSTGSTLYNDLTGFSGVFNNASGGLQLQISNVSNATGQFYLASNPSGYITNIQLTGASGQLNTYINSNGLLISVLTGQTGQYVSANSLGLTGSNLYNIFTGFSGVFNSSGIILESQITTLNNTTGLFYLNSNPSGFVTNLIFTGFSGGFILPLSGILNSNINSLSGFTIGVSGYLSNLIFAASAGVSNINGASGSLTLQGTGNITVIKNGQTLIISGDTGAYANFASISNLSLTGSNLYNLVTGFSGVFNNSGSILEGQIVTLNSQTGLYYQNSNPSGFVNTGYVTGVSGALQNQIAGFATTTNLTLTGSSLYNDIIGLSGLFNLESGALQSQITPLNTATGYLSNNIFSLSGLTTGISGYLGNLISVISGGVLSINNISGILTLVGTGNITVVTSGQTFIVSGDTGAYANFANVTNLSSTGNILYNDITGLSGLFNNQSGALQTQITNLNTQSGNVALTGSNLYKLITGFSGLFNLESGALQTQLTNLNNQSGNVALTGSNLYKLITGFSGLFNLESGALQSQITTLNTATGYLSNNIFSLSGFTTGMSGFLATANFATVPNLTLTGSTLYNDIMGFSGLFNNTSGALQSQITTLNNQSGLYYLASNPSGYIFNIQLTGSSGSLVSQISNVSGVLQNTINIISGNLSIPFITGGELNFSTGLQTGFNSYFIPFLPNFAATPQVYITEGLQFSTNVYPFAIQNQTTSGVTVIFSDVISDTGVFLNIHAKTVTGTSINIIAPGQYAALSVTNNFNIDSGNYRYIWSGVAIGTGLLPSPIGAYSGIQVTIKNKTSSFNLVISGNVDNQQNDIVTPLSNHILWSDGQTWNKQ